MPNHNVKCYHLPCKDCLPTHWLSTFVLCFLHLLSPQNPTLDQILQGASFGKPVVMHLFCKVRFMEEHTKLPPAQVREHTTSSLAQAARRGLLHGISSQSQEVVMVSDLQTLGLMGERLLNLVAKQTIASQIKHALQRRLRRVLLERMKPNDINTEIIVNFQSSFEAQYFFGASEITQQTLCPHQVHTSGILISGFHC